MLEDIAILTGGTVISEEVGLELKDTTIEQLGRAKSVKVQKENTVIVDGAGDKDAIAGRIAQIRAQMEETTSDFDKEKLQERLAKLAGGVAVVRVGAATETEMQEAKLRMEDALAATKAAVEEGIISGGGSAYIHASKEVAKLAATLEGDEKTGANIILKALEAPLSTIVVMGCGNQQVEKENPSVVSERASSVQDESEDGEKEFLSTYQNIIITLPEGWNVMRDEKIQCSFISEDGESLEISYREGMAKVILMDFPEDEESAENLLYPNEITGENSISDFMVKTANEGKDNESSFYRFQVKNSQQIPIAFFCGVKTENEGYQIIWKKGSGSNDTQQIVPEILESLQFPDNELLTETFQTACKEQKRALEAENNSDGVKKQKGKKTVTCISPVNVRTEPNVSTSQVIGALTTGEEVEMLGKENGWYKISYEGKTAYVYEDYVKEKEN